MKYDKQADPFYTSPVWRKLRKQALMRDGGMCVACMERFRLGYSVKPNRATMVHHVQPIAERPDLALDINNLRSLCAECHAKQHPEKGGRKSADDNQPKFLMRVIKV